MGLARKVGFDEVNVDDMEELLNSRKEELSVEDLVQVEDRHYHIKMMMRKQRSFENMLTLTSNRLEEAFRPVEECLAIQD